jgi:UDP-3-O-[3-hydroxymyristoyl] glucosamine N-acyltransferase
MITRTLAELALHVDGQVQGDGAAVISGIGTLQSARAGQISFLANSRYRKFLQSTQASAVIVAQDYAAECPSNALIVANPYVAYARIANLFVGSLVCENGVHASAVVSASAHLGARVTIGPHSVIGEGAVLGDDVWIGAGCVLGRNVAIGADSRLEANITLWHGTQIGQRGLIHPGAVIGADGFGLANDNGVWIKVPQLGCVRIGDDVEIGANTTIDCGALEDTIIEDGVKLDNLIQIGHNVHIGAHTAIAACTAIAGSTKIGKYCGIGGTVGIVGHLEIADRVQITGMSMVTKSITDAGVYSSGTPLEPNSHWHKNFARFKHLDEMWRRIKHLEAQLEQLVNKEG